MRTVAREIEHEQEKILAKLKMHQSRGVHERSSSFDHKRTQHGTLDRDDDRLRQGVLSKT